MVDSETLDTPDWVHVDQQSESFTLLLNTFTSVGSRILIMHARLISLYLLETDLLKLTTPQSLVTFKFENDN